MVWIARKINTSAKAWVFRWQIKHANPSSGLGLIMLHIKALIISTMKVPTMYVNQLCPCYKRWEHRQYLYTMYMYDAYISTVFMLLTNENTTKYMSVHCVHAINDENTNNVCMSHVYMLQTIRTPTMYVCSMCTRYQRWEHQQCINVPWVHNINDENTNNVCMSDVYMLSTMRTPTMYACPQCTCYQRWEHRQCKSNVYMLSTITALIMYVYLMRTCYQRLQNQQCMYVWCVHAFNDDSTNHVYMSTM